MRSKMSDQQPPVPPQGGQPYPPQGYYPPQQPPKKKNTALIVLIVLGVLILLFCGGCLAVGGLFANEVDKAIEEEEKNDVPTAVTEGEAFEHDGYNIDGGWVVKKDIIGDVTIEKMRVTNNGDGAARSAWLEFTFLKGSEVLAEVSCTSKELAKGQSSAMDCSSLDDLPTDYDVIKVADAF